MPDLVPEPMPPASGVRAMPGTALSGRVLTGGTPRLRIELTPTAAAVTAALLDGRTVAEAATAAGCGPGEAGAVARRLVATAVAGPVAARGSRPDLGDVAAVIPAHDAAATIAGAVGGLAGVGEVVVVDDGSSDGTGAVAEAAGATVVRNAVARGPAAARNQGVRTTAAPTVVVLDSDAAPEPGWLEPLLDHLTDPVVGGVAPRIMAVDDGSVLGAHEATWSPLDLGAHPAAVRPDGPVRFVSTTALVLRRQLWDELGGFQEDLRFGEDLDFAWRAAAAGRPLVHEPAVRVRHHHRSDLADHLRNRGRYGSAGGALSRRHPGRPRAAEAPPLLTAAAAAAVAGLPRSAASLAAASAVVTASRLHAVGEPPAVAITDSLRSNAARARGLAAAVSVPYLPVAALAARKPAGKAAVAGAVVARLLAGSGRPAGPGARNELALRFLEDLSLSIGVLWGCVAVGTTGPLRVHAPAGPVRSTTVLGSELLLP